MSIRLNKAAPLLILGGFVLVIGTLYWAREVFVPLALALLFTFLLGPLVTVLRRRGLNRSVAVIFTVTLSLLLLLGTAGVFLYEMKQLADALPQYQANIRERVYAFRRASKGGSLEKVQNTVKQVMEDLEKEDKKKNPDKEEPVPVVVKPKGGSTFLPTDLPLRALVSPLVSAGLVVVLVIFMLLRREELRNRLIRWVGYSRLTLTTKAIDEAGRRISRYLTRQSLLNFGYGICVSTGLFFIGVPYAFLWGFFAGLFRFIPYLGPWLGAALPLIVSLAVFDGWMRPSLVAGLFVVLELLNNMFLEPLLYGDSAGVSEVALLVMIAFWTWLWGPIGLLLATPLTVCLVVVSKYIPEMEFVVLLLGDEPVMERPHVFYQRLVARDQNEALEIAEDYLEKNKPSALYNELFIPALIYAQKDREREKLTADEVESIFTTVREILDELKWPASTDEATDLSLPPDEMTCRILGCPALNRADELALLMFERLLNAQRSEMRVLSAEILTSEAISIVAKTLPSIVCVGVMSSAAVFPARRLCKLLRARRPDLRILVGMWGADAREEDRSRLLGSCADAVGFSIVETRNQLTHFVQMGPAQLSGATPKDSRPSDEEVEAAFLELPHLTQ